MGFMAILAMAGAAVSAGGSIMSGIAQSNAANYQAQVARNNAQTAKQNATWSAEAGDAQALNKGLENRARIGAAKAAQGAGGVDVNTGSAASVRAGMDEVGFTDTETIRSNAARQTYGYLTQASNFEAQAKLDENSGDAAMASGFVGGLSSLLSGTSSAIGNSASLKARFGG